MQPRIVDHEEGRSQILGAFISLAAREGLHTVSLRAVAAEAGVSLRLVQYYFETKAGLMQAGLAWLEARSNARWSERLEASPRLQTARATLLALFEEALPTDRQSRDFHLLWTSYAILAMTDPDIPDRAFIDSPDRLQERLRAILEKGREDGEFREDLDAASEAPILLGLIHGLGTAVLIGQQRGEDAMAHLVFHIDRMSA